MHMKVFALPFEEQKESFDDRCLREFVKDKEVFSKSDYLFEKNGRVYLAVVVRYESNVVNSASPFSGKTEAQNLVPPTGSGSSTIQSIQLNDRQQQMFELMRKWRFERAQKQFIPAYMICSNKELERIIKTMPRTIEQLATIEGMSGTKLKNHGESMIEALEKMALN